MTPAEHAAQRALVTASLAAVHHPDFYSRRAPTPGRQIPPDAGRVSVALSSGCASHAPENTNAGQDGGSQGPATRECEYCDGKGTKTGPNGEAWRCHACKGRGRLIDQPTPRAIPNTRRFM